MNQKILTILIAIVVLAIGTWIYNWQKFDLEPVEAITRTATENHGNNIDGPFNHQVYSATSTDGLNWQTDGELLFDHASVPGAVITDGGTIFIYFVDGTNTVSGGPAVAKSTDLGETWTEYATNFENPITDKNCFADPEVELLTDDSIRLYLVCFPLNLLPTQRAKTEVISALSVDGLNFKIEDGKRVVSENNESLTDPDVIKIGDTWKIYISHGQNVVSLTSADGLDFVRDSGFRNGAGAVTGSYLISDNLARHFFCAEDGIRSATSSGGDWSAEDGVRIAKGENKMLCDPTVIQLPDGTYRMFYKIQP
ncbi:MAG: hypothetical protein WC924_00985 [Candidatus Gracilibacteria bacterium]